MPITRYAVVYGYILLKALGNEIQITQLSFFVGGGDPFPQEVNNSSHSLDATYWVYRMK